MSRTHLQTVLFLFPLILFLAGYAQAQEVSIKLGPDKVALNEAFTITAEVSNGRIRDVQGFPDIPGFAKAGQSSSTSTNIINGRVSSTSSITQQYVPQKQGSFTLSPFTMTVNGEEVRSQGKNITVGPEKERQAYDPFRDPFEDFFGNRRSNEPQEFIDLKEDAFLAVTTDKNEVYVGEGVNVSLAFYISEDNRAPLNFTELSEQITKIQKKLSPSNAWEENFKIEELTPELVIIDNKKYSKYKLYQASFFPFNEEDLVFPSVPLKMIKYKVAKQRSFFGRNRKEEYKTFHTKRKIVEVKPLPPHPLKETVAVGEYKLKEALSNGRVETGESFSYEFRIVGKGNIQSLNEPEVPAGRNIEFYPPDVAQTVRRNNAMVYGSKGFNYYGIPEEPGSYNLGDYFNWVYFDPSRGQYDTLTSSKVIEVTGESLSDRYISSSDMGSFYNRISLENNTLQAKGGGGLFRLLANVLILASLVLSAVFIFKK
ncbi:BatD family protein [Roseivirga sp. BDSF3-8]|uniref:BatD family protein n=1 Tax=Roseivirga sp. BDSF3-8 TaxID=3241598 RepID=UPI0035322BBF